MRVFYTVVASESDRQPRGALAGAGQKNRVVNGRRRVPRRRPLGRTPIEMTSTLAGVRQVAEMAFEAGLRVLVTGLGAACRYTPHSAGDEIMLLVEEAPGGARIEDAFLPMPESSETNVNLIPVQRPDVFMGSMERHGVVYAHALQAWLDLKHWPGGAEAASEMLATRLFAGH